MSCRISIITINYNNRGGLQKTMASVFSQCFDSFEYIIIDGGSTDGSKDLIVKHASRLYYWVSEKDNGIYHAMNKGIACARGEYVMFLNSGDYLVNNKVLHSVFTPAPTEDVVYGNLQTEHGTITYPGELNFAFFFRDSIGHVGSFIRRSLFKDYGLYNENNRLVSDWEFFLNVIVQHGVNYRHYDDVVTFFNSDGMSNKVENIVIHQEERTRVLAPLFPAYYPELVQEFDRLHNELQLLNSSRAINFVRKVMSSSAYQLIKK